MTVYTTFEAAQRRVDAIKRHHGAWPGIIICRGGGYRLTFDPAEVSVPA